MKVLLYDLDGIALVRTVEVLPLPARPSVVQWGDRVFIARDALTVPGGGDLSFRETVTLRLDELPAGASL